MEGEGDSQLERIQCKKKLFRPMIFRPMFSPATPRTHEKAWEEKEKGGEQCTPWKNLHRLSSQSS
jgi:hypothetical protein